MVTVEPFPHPTTPGRVHGQMCTVSDEMSGRSGPAPRRCAQPGGVTIRGALGCGVVVRSRGPATPLFVNWEPVHQPGSQPVHAADLVPREGLTTKEVAESMDNLRDLLGCVWSDVRFPNRTVRLMFGADPDDVLLKHPLESYDDIRPRPLRPDPTGA